MTTAGLTTTGFNVKVITDILGEIQQAEKDNINPILNVATTTPLGQLNGIYSEREALLWELLRLAYLAFDPDSAEGWLLDAICTLTGVKRNGAARALVAGTVTLAANTTLPQYSTAYPVGLPTQLFRTRTQVVSTTAGTYPVVFESVDIGPIAGPNAGTLTVIAGPVSGWNGVTNATDGTAGRDVETDTALRTRRNQEIQKVGGSTPGALRADLIDISGVISAEVFTNTSDTTDADNVPPHSIEVLVFDGVIPTVANNVIAQTIWDSIAPVRTYGNTSGVAVDSEGNNQTIFFSRPVLLIVSVLAYVTTTGVVPSDAATQIVNYLVSTANGLLTVGSDVVAMKLRSIILDMQQTQDATWIFDVPDLRLDLYVMTPTDANNIAVSSRQIAQLDTSRTTVTLL